MKQVTTLLTILTALNLFACGSSTNSPGTAGFIAGSPSIPSSTPSSSPTPPVPSPSPSPTPPVASCKDLNDTWAATAPSGANSIQIKLSSLAAGNTQNLVFNYQYLVGANSIREINCIYDANITSTDAILTYVSQDIEYSDFHCPATTSQYGPGGQLISTAASGTMNFTNIVQSCNTLTLKLNNQTYNFQ